MKEKGLSLIELIVTTVVVAIASLTIAAYFVSEYKFRRAMKQRISLSREARIAINHMTRVLRFAQPDTINDTVDNQIIANIEGGHVIFIDSETAIMYELDVVNNTIEYTQDEDTVEVANRITSFTPVWNDPQIEIQLVANEGGSSITVETEIRALGE